MLDPATQAEILRLYFSEKLSRRAIASKLGIHRSTVATMIQRRSVKLQPEEMKERPSILEPHYAHIKQLLEKDPARSAPNILQRLRSAGYRGGITILKDYLRACRPSGEPQAYLSLEFLPGQAAQVDWGEFGDVFGIGRKVHCFVMVLCFSRLLYLEFTPSANFESFIRCHEHALAFIGGVTREIWYDNLASAVAERRRRLVRFNPRFLVYSGHHRFDPIACNKGAAHEKGRVEDGVGYVRYNFWPGRAFRDLDDLNAQAIQWRDRFANKRTHATTRKIPELLFEQEKHKLMGLGDPFDTDEVRSARVSPQFRVAFDGNTYSVPWRLAGKILTLRADPHQVRIFYGPKRIARHQRCWRKGQPIVRKEHEEGLREMKPGAQPDADIAAIKSLGPNAARYIDLIPAQINSIRSELRHLMILLTVYGAQAVEKMMGQALDAGVVGAAHLERWLEQDAVEAEKKNPPPLSLTDARLILPHTTPNLKSYDAILMEGEQSEEDHDDDDGNPDRKPQDPQA